LSAHARVICSVYTFFSKSKKKDRTRVILTDGFKTVVAALIHENDVIAEVASHRNLPAHEFGQQQVAAYEVKCSVERGFDHGEHR